MRGPFFTNDWNDTAIEWLKLPRGVHFATETLTLQIHHAWKTVRPHYAKSAKTIDGQYLGNVYGKGNSIWVSVKQLFCLIKI